MFATQQCLTWLQAGTALGHSPCWHHHKPSARVAQPGGDSCRPPLPAALPIAQRAHWIATDSCWGLTLPAGAPLTALQPGWRGGQLRRAALTPYTSGDRSSPSSRAGGGREPGQRALRLQQRLGRLRGAREGAQPPMDSSRTSRQRRPGLPLAGAVPPPSLGSGRPAVVPRLPAAPLLRLICTCVATVPPRFDTSKPILSSAHTSDMQATAAACPGRRRWQWPPRPSCVRSWSASRRCWRPPWSGRSVWMRCCGWRGWSRAARQPGPHSLNSWQGCGMCSLLRWARRCHVECPTLVVVLNIRAAPGDV